MWCKIFGRNILAVSRKFCHSMASVMEANCIVPDVLDCAPKQSMSIYFRGGLEANCGNELTPTQVRDCPVVRFNGNECCFYTLLMTNPDVPCRDNPMLREWQHWLVVNIPGTSITQGEVVSQYVGAIPANGVGLQRFVFLVFQQQQRCWFNEPRLCNNSVCYRDSFCTRSFAEKYTLGEPLFGNFFQAQFDNYVNTLNKQLCIEES